MCRRVRGGDAVNYRGTRPPDHQLSAKAEHTYCVLGLNRGADDYVTKPFHYPELLARIGVVLNVSRAKETRTSSRTATWS